MTLAFVVFPPAAPRPLQVALAFLHVHFLNYRSLLSYNWGQKYLGKRESYRWRVRRVHVVRRVIINPFALQSSLTAAISDTLVFTAECHYVTCGETCYQLAQKNATKFHNISSTKSKSACVVRKSPSVAKFQSMFNRLTGVL